MKNKKKTSLEQPREAADRQVPIAQHQLVKSGQLILQDLSSCLPLEFVSNALKLDLELKRFRNKNKNIIFTGLDSTASPGNKALQLSELCPKVYALERDPKRAKVLQTRVEKANAQDVVSSLQVDFLDHQLDLTEDEHLKLIICDPSCSGSGMRLHGKENDLCSLKIPTPAEELERVKSLSRFQFKILAHALNYSDTVKYVSYSTCSVYQEEDEQIVQDVLKKFGDKWRIAPNMHEIVQKAFKAPKESSKKDEIESYTAGIH